MIKCKKCGSTDLYCNWEVEVPMNQESYELQDFLDGELYTDFIICHGGCAGAECTETEEIPDD